MFTSEQTNYVPSTIIQQVLTESAEFLLQDAVDKRGLVRAMYNFKTKTWQEKVKTDDFGDYAPFIIATGMLANRPEFTAQVKDLLLKFKQHTFDGIFHGIDSKFPLGFLTDKLRDNDDMLEGLLQCYRLTQDSIYRETALVLEKNISKRLCHRGFYCERSFMGVKLPRRVYSILNSRKKFLQDVNTFASADSNGFAAENLIALSKLTGNSGYLAQAQHCARVWIATKTFQKFHLFPDWVNVYTGRESDTCTTMKWNSHMGFALLALSEENGGEMFGQAFSDWYGAMQKNLGTTGGFVTSYNVRTGKKSPEVRLTYNHALFDIGIKQFERTEKKISLAKVQADMKVWVQLQTPDGLFPEYIDRADTDTSISTSDTQGDFLNMLMKFYAKTQDAALLPVITRGVNGLITRFFHEKYWYEDIYTYSGMPAKDTLLTKFCGGAMKCLILYEALFNQPGKIPDELLWTLVDDR